MLMKVAQFNAYCGYFWHHSSLAATNFAFTFGDIIENSFNGHVLYEVSK